MAKIVYFVLCIFGVILPLTQFIPWLNEYGFDMPLLIQQISADRLSAFAWLDVLMSAGALIVFVVYETKKSNIKYGYFSLFGLGIGVSLALPLFLLLRECHKNKVSKSII